RSAIASCCCCATKAIATRRSQRHWISIRRASASCSLAPNARFAPSTRSSVVSMHLEEGVLQAVLDGELDTAPRAGAERHVETCAECRALLAAVRQDELLLSRVLPSLDHTPARISVEQIIARAGRGQVRRQLVRWAAAVALVVLGAGALYAIPGSPLRRLVDRLVGKRRQPPAAESVSASGAGVGAGVALAPGARFRIVFVAPGTAGVTIRLTDDSMVDVRRIGGGTARYVAEIDGLRIETTGGLADFAIAIPRTAPWVEIVGGDRRAFLKDGARVVADTRPDSLGRYVVTLH